MSHAPRSPDLPLGRDTLGRVGDAVGRAARNLRAASFWLAIVLPAASLPLLAGGLTGREPLVFAALVAVNAGAFVLGHDHDPAEGS